MCSLLQEPLETALKVENAEEKIQIYLFIQSLQWKEKNKILQRLWIAYRSLRLRNRKSIFIALDGVRGY